MDLLSTALVGLGDGDSVCARTSDDSPVIEKPRAAAKTRSRASGAVLVAAGILLSRVFGLVRQRVFAHYFGNSMAAAAFAAALRIPNFLQNLFGEGVLSASFIPIYAGLLGRKDHENADRVAGAVFGLLAVATSVLVALGVTFAPWLIFAIAPGFEGPARVLTTQLVRVLFPGIGLLVLSAWCLGILNSHRKFFLSYAAPVLWNVAIIATLFAFGGEAPESLAVWTAWGTTAGCALQFGVQLPGALRLLGKFRPSVAVGLSSTRQVLRGFGPVVIGRGVVQLSAWVDLAYASLISERAVAALAYAQTIYLLPVSLFGMAISAAELPAMSQETGGQAEVAAKLRARIDAALQRLAFFVIPSAAAFVLLGDVVGGALLQTGRFTAADTRYAWFLLMGSAVGLLAATMGRVYASTFYALKDTRTPLYFAVLRVALTAGTAYYCVRFLPAQLGVPNELGAVGITATTGLAAWVEYLLLRRALAKRIGDSGLALKRAGVLWISALLAGAVAIGVKLLLAAWLGADPRLGGQWGGGFLVPPMLSLQAFGIDWGTVVIAVLVLAPYGVLYLAISAALGVPQSRALFARVFRRRA